MAQDFPGIKLDSLPGGTSLPATGNMEEVVKFEADFLPTANGNLALLQIRAAITDGWHIYSLTQKKGGPRPTVISLEESPDYELLGEFHPELEPQRHNEPAWNGLEVEEHHDRVTWVAPIQLKVNDPGEVTVRGSVRVQACKEVCLPPKPYPIEARRASGTTARKDSFVSIEGRIENSDIRAGGETKLTIELKPAPGWHAYALEARDPKKIGNKPTLIVLTETGGLTASPFVADAPIMEKESEITPGDKVRYYEGPVHWTTELNVPADARPGPRLIAGIMGYQTCTESSCDVPRAIRFVASVDVGFTDEDMSLPLMITAARYNEASDLADNAAATAVPDPAGEFSAIEADGSTGTVAGRLVLAFLAGLILNVMPCVLPVVGLKIMSFVQQAGESRTKVFALNVWYTLGILAVFLSLATLAVVFGMGWGDQFQKVGFTITMTAVIWVCALSFLGVWEIPIPGFAMSSSANQLAAKEGPMGAFLKGILTTLLATPCTGPFLIPTLTWAMQQPTPVTYSTFATMGLGMASPYLVIGAFPALASLLPKPGEWMNTFKQLMGFVLLGTVIFLLHPLEKTTYFVPGLVLMTGLGLACWRIGRTPLTAEKIDRMRAWASAVAITAVVGGIGFLLHKWDMFPFRTVAPPFVLPALTILAGLAFAVWWISRTPRTATAGQSFRAWAIGGSVGALVVMFAIAPERILGSDAVLPWEPYSQARLEELSSQGKTVMVDFTAEWCLTCKWNEHRTLNTKKTLAAINDSGVVPLLADKTNDSPEIDELLARLGNTSGGIPFLAIFPGDRPHEPIILRNLITQNQLLEAIRRSESAQLQSPAPVPAKQGANLVHATTSG